MHIISILNYDRVWTIHEYWSFAYIYPVLRLHQQLNTNYSMQIESENLPAK